LKVLLFAGGVYFADGSLLLILGSVARGVSYAWELNYIYAGLLAACLFAGIISGVLIGKTYSSFLFLTPRWILV
jgi:hypothetical protein